MNNEEFELLLQKASLGCCSKEDLLDAKERLESAVGIRMRNAPILNKFYR